MFFSFFKKLSRKPILNSKKQQFSRFQPTLERLEDRWAPSVSSTFTTSTGLLTVTSDSASDTITVASDTSGKILVNGTAVKNTPTLTNTKEIRILGQGGNDTIQWNLPTYTKLLTIDGGTGTDTLVETVSGTITLTNTRLGTQTLAGIENVQLTGGANNDVFDISAFTLGPVTKTSLLAPPVS